MNIFGINYKQRGNQPAILSQTLGLMFCFFLRWCWGRDVNRAKKECKNGRIIIGKASPLLAAPAPSPRASWPGFSWDHLLSRDIMATSLSEMGTGGQGDSKGFL